VVLGYGKHNEKEDFYFSLACPYLPFFLACPYLPFFPGVPLFAIFSWRAPNFSICPWAGVPLIFFLGFLVIFWGPRKNFFVIFRELVLSHVRHLLWRDHFLVQATKQPMPDGKV
jgi:hypothetical protein